MTNNYKDSAAVHRIAAPGPARTDSRECNHAKARSIGLGAGGVSRWPLVACELDLDVPLSGPYFITTLHGLDCFPCLVRMGVNYEGSCPSALGPPTHDVDIFQAPISPENVLESLFVDVLRQVCYINL